ncbi:ABC transporter substrate-binding protein [Paracidovorax sp. MALMAid1276]|uniref:ABC transporter substrate-binding protein n=1 Tax=Paracidovorax sp. MALMAid1276 TaxID=3411631 RepID=UPI003B992D56
MIPSTRHIARHAARHVARHITRRLASGLALALTVCALPGTARAQAQPAAAAITLGTTAPFSGPFAEYGEEYRKGADACLAPVNAAGGVRGRPLRIAYLDDAYDAPRAAANLRTLAGQGVAAFVNLVGTGPMLAMQPVLDELKIPAIGTSSGADVLRTPEGASPWVVHTKASNGDEFAGFARMLPTIGMTRIALVVQDNAFGKAGLASALKAFQQPGQTTPVVNLGQDAAGMEAAIAQVRQAEPHAVVLIAAGTAAPAFIAQYRQAAGASARVAVLNVVGGRVLTGQLKEQVAGILTAVLYPSPWTGTRRAAREYQAAMAEAGQELSLLSMEGCMNLRFAVAALRAAGDDASPAGVRRALDRGVVLDLGDFALRLAPGSRVASRHMSLGIYRANGRLTE